MYHSATADVDTAYDFKLLQYRDASLESTNTIDNDSDSDVAQAAPSTTHIYSGGGIEGIPIAITWDITIADVLPGDTFYLVFEFSGQADAGNNSVESTLIVYSDDGVTTDSYVNIKQLPNQRSVSVEHYLVHDVFDRLAYILTGQQNSFYSDFFGLTDHGYATDGCGGLNSITNGTKLRGISGYAPNLSMNDMLDWASARYGVGWGFENTGSAYRIRVELMEHFYTNVEVLDRGSPIENDSYIEGVNGLFEDFLTKSNYSLPISSVKGKYTQISPFIASNDLIQATYEERGSTNSWKYDEEIFLISVYRNGSNFVAETDEHFSTVAGLDDPTTAYNIRHAPVYMLLEHALIINSALFGKDTTELIQNTTAKINILFWAIASNYTCLLGDSQQLKRTSIGDISIQNNYAGLRLFKPVTHKLNVAMTSTQLTTLINDMEGNGSNNYGYVTYRDHDGNTQKGYVMNIQWNPNDEIANIETLEKADNYGI
jgi:hypothetical protein